MEPTPPTSDPDFALLERYVAHDCSEAENARVVAWLQAGATARATLESVRAICEGWQSARPTFDGDAAWTRVAPRVSPARAPTHGRDVTKRPTRSSWFSVLGLTAAVLVLVLGIGKGLVRYRSDAAGSTQTGVYQTNAGQTLTVHLGDGTQVTLGPASRFTVPATYSHGSGPRLATLDGEAYFAVAHDVRRPFTVEARGIVTRDVGTAFDIRAYPDDDAIRVAVVEGAVNVRPTSANALDGGALVTGGHVAEVTGSQVAEITVDTLFSSARVLAWMQGGLVFNAVALKTAARDIARAYGVEIRVADSALASKRVTATFSGGSLDEVLEAVTQALGAHFDRKGRVITIRAGVAQAKPPAANVRPVLAVAHANT